MFGCCLRDDRANEVVGQYVCPHFLSNELRLFASQDFHLHSRLDGTQIQLGVPVTMRPLCTVYLGVKTVELGDDSWLSYRRFGVGIVSSTGLLLSRQLCR